MRCRTCQIEKPQSDFYRNKTYSSGYDSRCKSCHKAYFAEYSKKPSVRARKNELNREWVKANPEKRRATTAKYRAENRDAMLEYGRQWSKDNRDKKNANWQRYRARKNRATVWNDPAIDYVYYAADVIKGICGGRPDVDHIIPLKHDRVSGLHVAQNLQLMNPSANYSKANTWQT